MKTINQSPGNQSDNVGSVELMDWFSQGESCELEVAGTRVVVRFIGRKGRRARIAVTAVPRAGDLPSGVGPPATDVSRESPSLLPNPEMPIDDGDHDR